MSVGFMDLEKHNAYDWKNLASEERYHGRGI